jgi:hypothetical protein
MTSIDNALPNVSGGYCVEIDAYYHTEDLYFFSYTGIPVSFKYPKADEIIPEQLNYIRTHFNLMESALNSLNYKDPINGYRKYLDLESFIRFFLVGEISGNTDTYWQTYMYKKRNDDKFYFGPVWDFDLAYENDNRTYPINNNSNWIYASTGSVAHGNVRNLINRLFTDDNFVLQLRAIYANYRSKGIISKEALLEIVDDYASLMKHSQRLNFMRWDIMNQLVHQNPRLHGNYEAEVNNIKRYISERIDWMDRRLFYVPTGKPRIPNLSDIIVFSQENTICFNNVLESVKITITDIAGRVIHSGIIKNNTSTTVPKGAYIILISDLNGNRKTIKCLVN